MDDDIMLLESTLDNLDQRLSEANKENERLRIENLKHADYAATQAQVIERLRKASFTLLHASMFYRTCYELRGGDDMETGRAWDEVHEAQNRLSKVLGAGGDDAQPKWVYVGDQLPKKSGHYFVEVRGDSEAIDGHVIYEFDAYVVLMNVTVDEDGHISGSADLDEDWCLVDAWWSEPVEIPRLGSAKSCYGGDDD